MREYLCIYEQYTQFIVDFIVLISYLFIMANKYSISIVGARRFSCLELAKLLHKHPAVKLETAFATREFSLKNELLLEEAASVGCFTDEHMDGRLGDIVFLATPNEVSAELAPKLLKQGKT